MNVTALVLGLIGGAGAGLGALVTYLVARRHSSGQIGTSDAATLWKESQEMRKELRDEVLLLRTDVSGLREEIRSLKQEIDRLRQRLSHAEGTSDG